MHIRNQNIKKTDAIILHIDGDRRYSKRAQNYYNRQNLTAYVENIEEKDQPKEVVYLLEKYSPNILVATGHDKMIKKGQDFYNINNYKNSKFFIQTVKNARIWEPSKEKLIIFAGACESFYEAIMIEGANFASSPARIMVEYRDPVIIASIIAQTPKEQSIKMKDLIPYLKSHYKAIGGNTARGQKNI